MLETGRHSKKSSLADRVLLSSKVLDHKNYLKLILLEQESVQHRQKLIELAKDPLSPSKISKSRKNLLYNDPQKTETELKRKIEQRSEHLSHKGSKKELRLPPIDKRTTNNTLLSRKNSEMLLKNKSGNLGRRGYSQEARVQVYTEGNQSQSTSPRKWELDEQASRHLSFLNQFQKIVVHSRMSGGDPSIFKKYR